MNENERKGRLDLAARDAERKAANRPELPRRRRQQGAPMRIHVDFDVHAATLDDAIAEAETKLSTFAPNLGEAGWDIVLHCSPSISSVNGDSALWHIQVEADR